MVLGDYDLKEQSDENLMLSYKHGDYQSFRSLYVRYKSRTYSYLHSRSGLADEAVDDIFQRVWVKLHKSRNRYDGDILFSRWLFTICRSELIDFVRQEKRYWRDASEIFSELPAHFFGESFIEHSAEPAKSLIRNDALTKEEQYALKLRFEEEMSFQEISDRVGVSSASLRKRVSRAIAKLRRLIGERSDESR